MSSTLAARRSVATRPAGAADEPFLRLLFAQSRDELALLPPATRAPLIDMQYRARRAQYRATRPGAVQFVLAVGNDDVGELIVDESGPTTHLVDLTVHADHRRQGLATAAVRLVLAAAAARGAATTLHVWSANHPARALYERLGFRYLSTGDGYLQLVADAARPEV